MGTLFVAAVAVVAVLLALAFFARGGATETPGTALAPRGEAAPLFAEMDAAAYAEFLRRLVSELGFEVLSCEAREERVDVVAEDPTPITGQRAYVRGVLFPADGMVQSAEVQAALDNARGSGLGKAIVVTPALFSKEAELLARDASVDLIDGPELEKLVRKHLPDLASRLVQL